MAKPVMMDQTQPMRSQQVTIWRIPTMIAGFWDSPLIRMPAIMVPQPGKRMLRSKTMRPIYFSSLMAMTYLCISPICRICFLKLIIILFEFSTQCLSCATTLSSIDHTNGNVCIFVWCVPYRHPGHQGYGGNTQQQDGVSPREDLSKC